MPHWDNCDPITVSIVPGECGPSRVPSEARCGDSGASLVPAEDSLSLFSTGVPGDFSVTPADPPTFLLSSTPYQIISADALGMDFLGNNGSLWQQPIEAVGWGFAVLDGILREVLVTYSHPAEAMEWGFDLTGGELKVILKTYTNPPEAMEWGFAITDGILDEIVILYNMRPEALDWGFTMIDGVLE